MYGLRFFGSSGGTTGRWISGVLSGLSGLRQIKVSSNVTNAAARIAASIFGLLVAICSDVNPRQQFTLKRK